MQANEAETSPYQRAINDALTEAEKGASISADKMFAWLEELRDDRDAPAPQPDVFRK